MDPSPSPTEEKRTTKKRPNQHIGRRIAEAAKLYGTDVSNTVFQRRLAAAATAGSRHEEGQMVVIGTKRKKR